MLRTRILAAVPILAVVYALLWNDARTGRSYGLVALMAVFTLLALREFYRMARARGVEPAAGFGYLAGLALVVGFERWTWEKYHHIPRMEPDLFSTIVLLTVLGAFVAPLPRRRTEGYVATVGTTLLGLAYAWFLPSFLLKMRHLGLTYGWAYDGIEFVFITLAVTKISDVGGFLVGSSLGRHRLIPWLSPKKTWEGLAGGVVASVGLLFLFVLLAPQSAVATLSWAQLAGLGLLLGFGALLGDLIESALKRDSQMKDAGGSVPGFGGILDLIDSLMVGAPAMYLYLIFCGARMGWTP